MLRGLTALAAVGYFSALSCFVCAISQQTTLITPSQQPPGHKTSTRTVPRPTNLQVLPKDIAVPDLLATMRGYTAALGVECEFCHASNSTTRKTDFASDTNADKAIARTMIRMTREINIGYLSQVKDPDATPADKTVTCGTCHRGNSMPMPFGAPSRNQGHHGRGESAQNSD
jgi:Photosynthetic reaction centre cytochrome C subunit